MVLRSLKTPIVHNIKMVPYMYISWNQNKVSWCVIENDHDFERTEDRATDFNQKAVHILTLTQQIRMNSAFLHMNTFFFFRKSVVLWFWKLLQRSRILVSTAEFSSLVNVLLIKSCSEFFIWNRISYLELVYNLILGNTVDSWFCHQFCLLMRGVYLFSM